MFLIVPTSVIDSDEFSITIISWFLSSNKPTFNSLSCSVYFSTNSYLKGLFWPWYSTVLEAVVIVIGRGVTINLP